MDLQRINKHKQSFDDICHYIEDDNGAEYGLRESCRLYWDMQDGRIFK